MNKEYSIFIRLIKTMEIDKIVFYYPSHITGGAEYLFLRCAEYLAEHQEKYKIFIVDYHDGFLRKNSTSERVIFIDYFKGQKTKVPDGSAFIVQLNIIGTYQEELEFDHQKSLILFWCLHFLNLRGYVYGENWGYYISQKDRKRIGEELKILSENNVIKFMGCMAFITVAKDFFLPPMNLEWLPNIAPIDTNRSEPSHKRVSNGPIKFCWLGRLDKEKAINVVTYMNELEFLSQKKHLTLSLIGDGPAKDYIIEQSKNYSYPIYFVGEKRDNELDEFIINESEIGLASGTSAYEFSLRGKPVIIIWLLKHVYEANTLQNYYITSECDQIGVDKLFNVYHQNQSSFMKKVDQILFDYEGSSEACYKYVLTQSANVCCEKLVQNIEYIAMSDADKINNHLFRLYRLLQKGSSRSKWVRKICGIFSKHANIKKNV